MDTTPCLGGVFWGFWGKRGPEPPDAGDFLEMSWSDGAIWTTEDAREGAGITDSDFSWRSGSILDALALTATFSISLRSVGGPGGDEFDVDDFIVGCLP